METTPSFSEMSIRRAVPSIEDGFSSLSQDMAVTTISWSRVACVYQDQLRPSIQDYQDVKARLPSGHISGRR